jgi:hypothetical protein
MPILIDAAPDEASRRRKNRLREKTDSTNPFKPILPVQSSA